MRKIPTVYQRDEVERRYVTDEVNPECQWVLDGEGVATRKYDGTCVMLDEGGAWWARREIKPGKSEPEGFVEVNYDPVTGKRMGWEPIEQSAFAKAHAEALGEMASAVRLLGDDLLAPGTYELVGPKVNGNPERYERHWLVSHERAETDRSDLAPMEKVRTQSLFGWEGIVWHHPDGRMAKLKGRDLR